MRTPARFAAARRRPADERAFEQPEPAHLPAPQPPKADPLHERLTKQAVDGAKAFADFGIYTLRLCVNALPEVSAHVEPLLESFNGARNAAIASVTAGFIYKTLAVICCSVFLFSLLPLIRSERSAARSHDVGMVQLQHNHSLQRLVLEQWTGEVDLYLHQPDGSVLQLVAADATCPATAAVASCCQTPDAHSDAQLLGLRECAAGMAKAFGITPRGATGAAELRACADGDGDGEVSSTEAGDMLTTCVAYEGAPRFTPSALARLRGLAGC